MVGLNIVSSSPHIRSKDSTQSIMRDVIIALIPATLIGFYMFGIAAVFTVMLSMVSAVGAEYVYQRITHQKITIKDYSAAITGLLLGLNLPASLPDFSNGFFSTDVFVPFTIPILGSIFAIVIVKQLFGGLGFNFMNPALAARAFLLVSFADQMTTWPKVDAVSTATVLGVLKEGGTVNVSVLDTFLGSISGSIGEISALALILGGCYLVYRKVISYRIPVFFVGTVTIFVAIYSMFSANGFDFSYVLLHIFSGGLLLGAIFMATDYVTSPMTPIGQVIFAIGCGVITALIRLFGSYPEGVSFAIIIMNLTVPLIDRYTIPRGFGEEK